MFSGWIALGRQLEHTTAANNKWQEMPHVAAKDDEDMVKGSNAEENSK